MSDPPSAPEPKGDCCDICRYYMAVEHPEAHGVCRRYPPDRQRSGHMFPGVYSTDWCGEFADVKGPPPLKAQPLPA